MPIVFFTLTKNRFVEVNIFFCFLLPFSMASFLFLIPLSIKKVDVLKKKVIPIKLPMILIKEAVMKLKLCTCTDKKGTKRNFTVLNKIKYDIINISPINFNLFFYRMRDLRHLLDPELYRK